MPSLKWFYMNNGYFTEASVHIFLTILSISTKLYTNLENSQSFQIMQVKLMTFDLIQGHVIQYGSRIHFQSAKINL